MKLQSILKYGLNNLSSSDIYVIYNIQPPDKHFLIVTFESDISHVLY